MGFPSRPHLLTETQRRVSLACVSLACVSLACVLTHARGRPSGTTSRACVRIMATLKDLALAVTFRRCQGSCDSTRLLKDTEAVWHGAARRIAQRLSSQLEATRNEELQANQVLQLLGEHPAALLAAASSDPSQPRPTSTAQKLSRIRKSLNPGRQNSRRPLARSCITPCWRSLFLYFETCPLFFPNRRTTSD